MALDGAEIIRTPVQAPNANALAERWVGTVRRESLDQLLVVGCQQLIRVLRTYVEHYNLHRPHRSLAFATPLPSERGEARSTPNIGQLRRRDVLGGLIHEYDCAAGHRLLAPHGAVVVTALGVLVALSVAELRRLLARLIWHPPVDPVFTSSGRSGAAAIKPPLDAATTSNNAENLRL